MRILDFKIKNQRLSKNGDFSNIVRGTKNYLKCRFDMEDADWFGVRKIAVFENGGEECAVALERDNTCEVPNEVTDKSYFKVKLVGVKMGKITLITNKALINQR